MSTALDEKILTSIITELLKDNYYHDDIKDEIPQMVSLIKQNEEIRRVMRRIIQVSHFEKTKTIDRDNLKEELEAVNNYFEYFYFTSPTFLREAND